MPRSTDTHAAATAAAPNSTSASPAAVSSTALDDGLPAQARLEALKAQTALLVDDRGRIWLALRPAAPVGQREIEPDDQVTVPEHMTGGVMAQLAPVTGVEPAIVVLPAVDGSTPPAYRAVLLADDVASAVRDQLSRGDVVP